MKSFQIQIASPYDREYLVCEIWYNNDLIAEINQEKGHLELQVYHDDKSLSLPLELFIDALNKAKKELIGDVGI